MMDAAEEQAPQISPQEFIAEVTGAENIAALMDDAQLKEIAQDAIAMYDMDKESMSEWFDRMERGLDLAKLVKQDKTYPFKNAANIKYPLITSAALQFNARAYPAIVPPDRIVKAKVWGADPQGKKAARADRISEHMSWQLATQVEEWDEDTDKMLTILPIVGTMFRKWWFDPVQERARCRLVDPGKLIINNKVKTLSDAPRITEEIELFPSEIETRVRSGQFIEFDYNEDPEDAQACQEFIEQHTRIDLDEDGYPEPYIVTVHTDTQSVVRLVADFAPDDVSYDMQQAMVPVQVPGQDPMTGAVVPMVTMQPQEVAAGILEIRRGSYFVAYQFLPSMDGGFHGTGLGLLLGDISESINTIINMLMDAGHYASLGGGFIGADFRMKGGAQRHRPGEWKMVNSSGAAIRDSLVPITFPGPDGTLFQMLGMLIEAGREIASVKDVMTGDGGSVGKNASPTTTLALIEQGMMVFTAAYKRIYRALGKEFRMLARINADAVSPQEYNAFHDGQEMFDPRQDYGAQDMDIQPVADPRSVTKMQQASKAQLVMQLAEMGLVDRGEALQRVAEAMDIEDVEKLLPQPDPMQQQMVQMQAAAAMAELHQKRADIELTLAKIESERASATKDMAQAEAEQAEMKLNIIKADLEDERERLGLAIQSAARMAGQSRDGNSAQGNGGADQGAERRAMQALLGGQTGPGGGSGGVADGGAMGGGFL